MLLTETISIISTKQAKEEEPKISVLDDITDEEVISRRIFPRLFYLALILLFLIPYWIGLIKIGSWILNLFR